MPWLTGTAFIHSVMVQERRGMRRIWNVSLHRDLRARPARHFRVRSGSLEWVHAFGASTLGVPVLVFIAVVVLGSVVLVVQRVPDLGSIGRLGSLLSREAILLQREHQERDGPSVGLGEDDRSRDDDRDDGKRDDERATQRSAGDPAPRERGPEFREQGERERRVRALGRN